MKTEEQVRKQLYEWIEKREERKKYGQDYAYESVCIACYEWVLNL